MSASRTRGLAHGLWLGTALLFASGTILLLFHEPAGAIEGLLFGLPIAMYATVGALVARRRPENPIGWLFCVVALSLAVWMFARSYAEFGQARDETFGTLPGAAAAVWIGTLAPMSILPIALPFFLLVFPDGHLRSPGWRIAVAAAGVGGGLVLLGAAATIDRYAGALPMQPPEWVAGIPSVGGFLAAGLLLAAGAAFAGLLSLAARFRSAEGARRQQLRLLLWMLVAMAVAPVLALPLSWFGLVLMLLVDGGGVLVGIPAATAVAVLTYGLYDVGVVVKKTIVYGLLVAILTGFVALVVFFIPSLAFGAREGSPAIVAIVSSLVFLALTIAATWRLTRRMARRIVYGKRATPYEAVSEFSERLGEAYSTEDVLPRMAKILREGTGAERVRVWLRIGGELRAAAASPAEPLGAVAEVPIEDPELPSFDDGDRAVPVIHHGDLLGAVSLRMPASEPLRGTGEKLVVDVASQAGLVLRNVRLTEELRETIEELRASRQRIVTAQDERARKLERDIHDGAQQQLVALSVKLRLADSMVEKDPAKAHKLLSQLQTETTEALEDLRDLARGIYPPLLADKGLTAAIEAQARKWAIPIEIRAAGVGRYPKEAEAAVYFCCLEALQNVAKYAAASTVCLRLAESNGDLTFSIEDDGVGFDATSRRGSGLTNMRDRLEALGGRIDVRSAPGEGTTVTGWVPAAREEHPV